MDLVSIAEALKKEIKPLRFGPPVSHVYNPLQYAGGCYSLYVSRYGAAPKEILFLGMNPGPWGMAQTGIPFGEVGFVRDWLDIVGAIERPAHEHPKRPIMGFDCTRSEVSGRRVWAWAKECFSTPERFFARFFIANYCPLLFLEKSGRNRTPDKLPASEKAPLLAACDRALVRTVDYLKPDLLIGFGRFAQRRAQAALSGSNIRIASVAHPSPANPRANKGWKELLLRELESLGIKVP